MTILHSCWQRLLTPLLAMLALLSASFTVPAALASDITTGWLSNPQHPPVAVRLMLTGQQNPQAKTVEALLEVQLDPDWKTYWRSPGESGVAPSIDWSLSNNLTDVDWQWPVPKRYEFLGVETLGYKDHIVFPLTLHVEDMRRSVFLSGQLTMSSCTNICVLTDYELSLDFTPSRLTLSQEAMHLYNQGLSLVPQTSPAVSLTQVAWDENAQMLTLAATNTMGWQQPDVFIDGETQPVKDAYFLAPDITTDGSQLIAQIPVKSWFGVPALLGESINVTLSDANIAVEMQASVSDTPVALSGLASTDRNLTEILLIALLGGLILNMMPCVLPVLGLKLSTAITGEHREQRQIRTQFLASSAGILVSFWLLAGFLAALKLSGQALGWGIQFQSPYFIGAMILITGLFAANMLGLFEIRLPGNASTWLATRGDHSHLGHFIQGMFATLLATPCSAPFLGTAVAFALGADLLTLFVIFTALAVGMAAPWLLVAAFPALARLMPKPGAWMNRVKLLFGLMLLATSLWLLSLMTNFLTTWMVVATGTLLLTLLLWQLGRQKGRKPVIITLAVILFSSAGGLLIGSVTADQWATPLPADHPWQTLNVDQISRHVQEGNVVMVDVTADWCITCKANKIGVLLQDPVYSALGKPDIVRMRGDWTHPSDYVTGYLQSYGRFGVPFNIVYGPGAPHGIALPVILTQDTVLEALRAAASPQLAQEAP
ncbi:protein-disulfide reductase DsbD family protein [Photobacterium sp. TY1-4]|uniref:protein-disulfide reductase DsbD family protein n=1 Tax=Photobacterium sp. TY1-4 TaxID=2899122 RepID=UPI0021BE47AC|nr:protein-disulfide reductase DsbD domain-containing protein [Photobacterium sp. TY1-4]UXI04378.1 thioredoxin family protein [Photobacterium sp. TY1-4]